MIPDLDIYQSAQALIKQHGTDAPIEAAMRADAMLDKCDLDGFSVWKRVLNPLLGLIDESRHLKCIHIQRLNEFVSTPCGTYHFFLNGSHRPPSLLHSFFWL